MYVLSSVITGEGFLSSTVLFSTTTAKSSVNLALGIDDGMFGSSTGGIDDGISDCAIVELH